MKIEKEDVIRLMKETINRNWLDPNMNTISSYENAISFISGFKIDSYEGKNEDIEKIMLHINEYSDFKIENIYDIIYKYQPWNFMNSEQC